MNSTTKCVGFACFIVLIQTANPVSVSEGVSFTTPRVEWKVCFKCCLHHTVVQKNNVCVYTLRLLAFTASCHSDGGLSPAGFELQANSSATCVVTHSVTWFKDAHANTHTYTQIDAQARTHTHMLAQTNTHTHAHAQAPKKHTYTRTHAHTHTHTVYACPPHTHTHTHIHTH